MHQEDKIKAIREKVAEAHGGYKPDGSSTMRYWEVVDGGEVRLADVLLAIPKVLYVNTDGYFIEKEGYAPTGDWNLRNDDLTHQSPETIDFLYDLLAKELKI